MSVAMKSNTFATLIVKNYITKQIKVVKILNYSSFYLLGSSSPIARKN